jgi:hypothetical protein
MSFSFGEPAMNPEDSLRNHKKSDNTDSILWKTMKETVGKFAIRQWFPVKMSLISVDFYRKPALVKNLLFIAAHGGFGRRAWGPGSVIR